MRWGLALVVLLVASACTGIPGDRTAEQALTDYLTAANGGDIDAALGHMASDAVWVLDDSEIPLAQPLREEAGWLITVFGLADDATFRDAAAVLLESEARIETERNISGCQGDETSIRCDYTSRDAASVISGVVGTGVVTVEVADDRIVRYETALEAAAEPAPAWDEFRRWARIENPSFGVQNLPTDYADLLVPLISQWEEAGRPDVAPSPNMSDPIEVVEAILAAQAAGDWELFSSLLGGEALDAELGTWGAFQAAGRLERVVTPETCEVTLESDRLGAAVACRVTVNDIILDTANIKGTQWNATTFHVKAGRVTTLPVFIPSSAVAERTIEEWAAREHADEYAEACPDGIVDPTGIESLPCAEFIVRYRTEWSPPVGATLSGG
jgi:hypothetical protein